MSLLNYFRSRPKQTANVAKERLQIIIAHERTQRKAPNYLPKLQEELVRVIAKYVDIDSDQVKVQLDKVGENAILELNVTLPDEICSS